MEEKILSLWAINDELILEKAFNDIDIIIESGMDGVIFHPRNYTGKPPYLSTEYFGKLDKIIDYCKANSIEFWLYDENGWPSGTGDGKVLENNPNLRQEWIEMRTNANSTESVVNKCRRNGVEYEFIYKAVPNPSSIDSKATQQFLDVVYEGYKTGLSANAFEYVTGFFSDETAFPINKEVPSIPWSDELADLYENKTGRNLIKDLPSLFFSDIESQITTEIIKVNYWESATDLLKINFYELLSKWCENNNKRFTAHLRGEENLALSVPFSGSAIQVLKSVDIPMIDALERIRDNEYYPLIASTLAQQFGDGNSFCEALGGAGWGIEPKNVINYYDWLIRSEVNITCLHLSQYKLKSQAIKDWPPSMPKHLTWQPLFKDVLSQVREKYEIDRKTSKDLPTLVIAPVRRVISVYNAWELSQTNRHRGEIQPNTRATKISDAFNQKIIKLIEKNIRIHITDERTFEENSVAKGNYFLVGKQQYEKIIYDEENLFVDTLNLSAYNNFKQNFESLNLLKNSKVVSASEEINQSIEIAQGNWKIKYSCDNLVPFQENNFIDRKLEKDLSILNFKKINLISTEELEKIFINGKEIDYVKNEYHDQIMYEFSEGYFVRGENRFTLLSTKENPSPLCWLHGDFVVNLIETNSLSYAGNLYIDTNESELKANNLSEKGYPFQLTPIELETKFTVNETLKDCYVEIESFSAAAATIIIDEEIILNYWSGEKNSNKLSYLSQGNHKVNVILYPHNFNAYGPSKYIGGDACVISPSQYSGKKNIIDPEYYPEVTEHQGYNFRKVGIGSLVIRRRDYSEC